MVEVGRDRERTMNLGKMRHLIAAVVLGFAAILAACTVTVEEDGPPPPRPGGICPRIYQPVCAERFGERDTFPNACVAESRGYDVIYRGECRRRPPRPEPLPDDGPVVCPLDYRPVCARQGGIFRTFGNRCAAEASGFRVVARGEC
jgi:Kazal-type serine protease inhibitor domain